MRRQDISKWITLRFGGKSGQKMISRGQIAKVVDEFGGVSGIVILEDVIETLLGSEITGEPDEVEVLRAFARERLEYE